MSTADESQPALLHEYFARAVRRWPDRLAVDVPPGSGRLARTRTTYAQLDDWSTALAWCLAPHVAGECIVGILLSRDSAALYAAQLAVLKAGAAYVCLDTTFPAERARDILADAEVTVLITDGPGGERARTERLAPAVLIDAGRTAPPPSGRRRAPAPHGGLPGGLRSGQPPWLTPESLAYLIYTSGSTGRPKGVMIAHRGVVNLVASDLEAFALTPQDRVVQGSSPAYDSSVEETWIAFAAGATVVVMDDETVRLGPDLVPWLRDERVSVFCPAPTLLRATGCLDPRSALPDLRLLYVGGEALPADVADRWAPGRHMVNGYGPTECSVVCLRGVVVAGEPVAIGRPIRGMQAWVLDDALDVVTGDGRGELCVGGPGLARGYWKQPELTAAKFIERPDLGRVYRTGDLVHRDANGRFFYHGRIDAQVKIRGHRVELGEIESHLAQCAGVRAAACRLQGEGGDATLVAFIVPDDPLHAPSADALRAALGASLPAHMVPSRFGILATLPTTVGGKLDRARLPLTDAGEVPTGRARVRPRTPLEARLDTAFTAVLRGRTLRSVHDDFFADLGGDSLRAAELVTHLRDDPATAWVTVRDVYETRTVAGLAARAPVQRSAGTGVTTDARASETRDPRHGSLPTVVTLAQAAWLLAVLVVSANATWWFGFELLPRLVTVLGVLPFIVLAPTFVVVAFTIYTPCAVLAAVATKRLLIGRYRPLRAPVWNGFYLRNWIVQSVVRLVPWASLEGTIFQQSALRALGARIGTGVHIHRGVDLLRGGWDLLEIGDGATIGQDAMLRLVDLEQGEVVVGPVTVGPGATLDVRAGVGPGGRLDAGAYLTALSSLPAGGRVPPGEKWDGIPAAPAGPAPTPPALPEGARVLAPWAHGLLTMAARAVIDLALLVPLQVLSGVAWVALGLGADDLWAWFDHATPSWTPVYVALAVVVLNVPATLGWAALVMRMLGRVPEGVMSRWSPVYVRVWVKAGLLQRAGDWLSGTLFWPVWLRWAGMRVGRGCEISTIIDVVPELITIGPGTFFADGIYLGGPRVQQGVVTLASTSLGTNTFLGNHVVVPAGQALPSDVLLGVCTPADDTVVRPGTSWFGHPPFELPRREVVTVDRRLTHEPSAIRYWNRLCWELARFGLPIVPLLVLVAWYRILAGVETSSAWFLAVVVPLVTLGAAAVPAALVLAMKWALLGRVKPGQHPLWSCWCSRWDFLYVAWSQYARRLLGQLDGTLLLPWYLRAMGTTIGRRVVLGPGFAQVVDPDMITIEDDATVHAMFQAHTFEDRVLKIDRVTIGRGATLGAATVPLYGAVFGEGTFVAPHSVVMKRERLSPHVRYEGAPTRPQRAGLES